VSLPHSLPVVHVLAVLQKMIQSKTSRNWVAVTGIATLVALFTLWMPWIFIPVEVMMKRERLPEFEFPELRNLLTPFSTIETGLHGAIDLGVFIPSWIFITLIVASGILTILTILKIFEVSHWIVIFLIGISGSMLTYWIASSIAEGSTMQSGLPIALVASGTILLAAIKNNQSENKSHHATTGSGCVCDD